MRSAAGFLGIVLLSVFSAGTVGAQVITLAELERQAVQKRPALDANEAATRGAQAEVDRAFAAYYPVVSFETSAAVSPGNQLRRLNCDASPDKCDGQYAVAATRQLGEDTTAGDILEAFGPT